MKKENLLEYKEAKFFDSFTNIQIKTMLNKAVLQHVKKGYMLYEKNSDKNSGIFVIINGKVDLFEDNKKKPFISFNDDSYFNLLSIFYSHKRSYSAKVSKDSKLIFIKRDDLIKFSEKDHNFKKVIYKLSSDEFDYYKLKVVFKNLYGDSLDISGFIDIFAKGEWINLESGSKLFDIGDKSDAMFFLISGLLKVFITKNNKLKQIGEVYPGEVIGEMGILSDDVRSASIFSMRESVLFKLTKKDANLFMVKYPSLIIKIAKKLADRLKQNQSSIKKISSHTSIYSIVHLSKGDKSIGDKEKIGNLLFTSMKKLDKCFYLSSDIVNDYLNIDINKTLRSNLKFRPIEELLEKISNDNNHIILSCDMDYTPWTKWCTLISDSILNLIEPSLGLTNQFLINDILKSNNITPKHLLPEFSLVVYHKTRKISPKDTSKFFKVDIPFKQHYHVSLEGSNDIDRLSRNLIGKNINLCLSGGGAKGNAHIGVFKALQECNIPVDSVSGTSAGGIIASLIACGYNSDEIIDRLKKSYKKNIFNEYTLPYSSIVATNKVIEDAKILAEGKNVEDLWLPMFTCAVNISKSILEIIDKGPLWIATRATAALPAILLPVIKDNSFLVDGGLINNMPGDISIKKFGGKLISVSVNPQKSMDASINEFPPQATYFIKSLFLGKKAHNTDIPNLATILMRSIDVGSASKAIEVQKLSDIFLNPQIENVGMLDFNSIDESVEIGYKYAMKELEKIDHKQILS